MALVDTYGIGRNVRATAAVESTFNTPVTPAAGQSFKLMSYSISPGEERKDRRDTRQVRDQTEVIIGKRNVEWQASCFVLPEDGGSGTAPNISPYLQAALGSVSGVGSGPVVYATTDTQSTPPSVCSWFEQNGIFAEGIAGGVVEDFSISIPGGEEPTFSFSGMAVRQIIAGNAVTTGSTADGTDTVSLDTATSSEVARQFEVNGYIQVGTSTAHEITAVDTSANSLTVSPNISGTQGSGSAVIPWTPWADTSTGGEPVPGITGSLGLTGIDTDNDLLIVAAEINVKNNWKRIDGAFRQVMQDAVPGWREVTGSITFFVRDPDIIRFARGRYSPNISSNRQACTIVLGDSSTSGSQYVSISLPRIALDFAAVEVPEAEESTVQVPFRAFSSTPSSASNSISLTFNTA